MMAFDQLSETNNVVIRFYDYKAAIGVC